MLKKVLTSEPIQIALPLELVQNELVRKTVVDDVFLRPIYHQIDFVRRHTRSH